MTNTAGNAPGRDGGGVLYAEELTANENQAHIIQDLDLARGTVSDLMYRIALAIGNEFAYQTLKVVYAGAVLEDSTQRLSNCGIHGGDTVYFVRSLAEAPPAYSSRSGAELANTQAQVVSKKTDTPEAVIILKTLFFRDLDGKSLTLTDVDIDTPLNDVFRRLGSEKAMDTEWLRFIWSGKQLQEGVF